ncbi:MAG: ASCH domain-containing protein [Intrasporangium sp.]|uniref:ASCH domain-containing protein n=1 Tax=Intrasporangium sp. TaxID=1925024 RepID=UPI002648EE52|nr:ASCH domain-containing protein [Intrasporangium sp.]MDN5795713.1 ASCH domain-containing protein [Intrasporangium sp.]
MTTSRAGSAPVEPNQPAAQQMWEEYIGVHPEHRHEQPPSESFGDSAALADELLELVIHGPKRATAGAVADYRHEQQPLPRIGGHWIVHDGSGVPRAVLQSVELRLGPLSSVDASFAWDEGEGDRTREDWVGTHRRYFQRTLPKIGVEYDDEVEVVFERFRLVWPAEYADA